MASAAVLALGKGAIKKLQQLLLNVRDVELIHGITDSSLTLGRHIAADKHKAVVFVGRADASQELAIRQMGALLYSDDVALEPQEAFLKRISMQNPKRTLHLYALSEDEDSNVKYVVHLLGLLKKADIAPSRTSLVLLGQEERHGGDLQATKDHYGYGEVKAFDHSELTARLLLQKYPLSKVVEFDDDGLAKADVEVLLVGFGPMGQEVLKRSLPMVSLREAPSMLMFLILAAEAWTVFIAEDMQRCCRTMTLRSIPIRVEAYKSVTFWRSMRRR